MNNYEIPSEEEFEDVEAADDCRNRGLSKAASRVEKRFHEFGLHKVYVFYSPTHDVFGAYVFYECDSQIDAAEKSGLTSKIKQAVIEELIDVGRGTAGNLKVTFEIDSDEEVQRNYEGDYSLRLK